MDVRSVSLTKELTDSEEYQQKDSTLKVPGFISVMSQVCIHHLQGRSQALGLGGFSPPKLNVSSPQTVEFANFDISV